MNLKDLILRENSDIKRSIMRDFISSDKKLIFYKIMHILNYFNGYNSTSIFKWYKDVVKGRTFENSIKETACDYHEAKRNYPETKDPFKDIYTNAEKWCEGGDKPASLKLMAVENLLVSLATCCHYVINKKEYSNIAAKNAEECLDVLKNKFKINFPKLENDLKSF